MNQDEFVWNLAALVVALSSTTVAKVDQLLVGLAVTLVGAFGTVFSGKLTALIHMHQTRSYAYLDLLAAKFPDVDVSAIKTASVTKSKTHHPLFSLTTLNRVWFGLHFVIMLSGLAITLVILFRTA